MSSEILSSRVQDPRISRRIFITISVLLAVVITAAPVAAQSSTSFSFPDRGGVSLTAPGASSTLGVGSAQINQTAAVAAGFAIFGFRQNGVLVTEATVPAASLVNEGRIYAEIGGGVDTGVAIANSNNQAVDIAFYFTDSAGTEFGASVLTLPPNGQIAQFLSQAPFNGGSGLIGTFTFFTLRSDPDVKVGAIALRGFTNERGEFLLTTLPIAPVGQRGLFGGDILPQFASGGGWTTQVVLVNPTAAEEAGTISFIDQTGAPSSIASENGSGAGFNYRIAAKSAWRLRTSNAGALHSGSVRIRSSNGVDDIPAGFLIFSFQAGSVTVSAAGVPPTGPATATRLFVEASGQFVSGQPGSLQTGIAISNAGSTDPVHVSFDLTALDGTSTGVLGALDIPAGGQSAKFLYEIPGFAALPASFQGVLRISSPSTPISVTGIRGRYNERGDFLLTTVPAVNENDQYFNLALRYSGFVFPDFVDGAGYTTQFVLFSGWTTGTVNGTLAFFNQAGNAFALTLQ